MLLTLSQAALLCLFFFLVIPASFLVQGSWPVLQIAALLVASLIYGIWIKRQSARAAVSVSSTELKRQRLAFDVTLCIGAIAIACIAVPQARRMLEHCDYESRELRLGAINDRLRQMEQWDYTAVQLAAEPTFTWNEMSKAAKAPPPPPAEDLTLESLDTRIAAQKDMLDSRAKLADSWYYDESLKVLNDIETTRADYLAMPFRFASYWITIVSTLLFNVVSFIVLGRGILEKSRKLAECPATDGQAA